MMDEKTLRQMSEHAHKVLRLLEVRAKGRGLKGLAETLEILNKDLASAMTDAFGGSFDWEKEQREFREFDKAPKPGIHNYSISGVECELFMVRGDDVIQIPMAQGISWSVSKPDNRTSIAGSIICILLGPSPFEVGVKFDKAIIQSEMTKDRFMHVLIEKIMITGYGSGVSIDDISVDENYTFSADKLTPWRPGQMVAKTEGDGHILMEV